jgi:NADH-quinone oxidoreductase subunit J
VTVLAFILLAILAVASAVAMVSTHYVVRSALYLVVNFLVLAALYFTMNLEILGVSQLLVYTGLIMMLFLFCILLLNLGAPEMLFETNPFKVWVAVALAMGLLVIVLSQVFLPLAGMAYPTAPDDFGKTATVGNYLFNRWVYGFEIASILLLVGIVGSILVAKRRT